MCLPRWPGRFGNGWTDNFSINGVVERKIMNIRSISFFFALFILIGVTTVSAQQSAKTPEQVAQSLIDAYNARNLESIVRAYAPDSIAYALPSGEVILKGHDAIRKKFARILDPNVKFKAEVLSRIVDGKFVIDKEKISRTANGKVVESFGTVIYEITDGLIRTEWYLRQ